MLCACVMPPHLYSFILQILYFTCLPSQGPQRWLTNLNSLFCLIKLSEAESLFNLLMCEHQRACRVVTLQRTMFRECEKIRTANLLDVLELFIKQSWQRMYIFFVEVWKLASAIIQNKYYFCTLCNTGLMSQISPTATSPGCADGVENPPHSYPV